MKIKPAGRDFFLPPVPGEERETDQEEAMKKVEKAKRAVEQERLEIMDRHHESVRKSAETYEKIVKKKLLEEEVEKRRLQSVEFLEKSMEEAETRRKIEAEKRD